MLPSAAEAGENTSRMGSSVYACGADQRGCLMEKDVARHIQPFQRRAEHRACSLSATFKLIKKCIQAPVTQLHVQRQFCSKFTHLFCLSNQ